MLIPNKNMLLAQIKSNQDKRMKEKDYVLDVIEDPIAQYIAYFFFLPMIFWGVIQAIFDIPTFELWILTTLLPFLSLITLPLEKYVKSESNKMCFWWPYLARYDKE